MSASYRMVRFDRPEVVSAGRPELMGDFLRHEDWPPRRYEITRVDFFQYPGCRWGVVVKHPDGSVELVPDQA